MCVMVAILGSPLWYFRICSSKLIEERWTAFLFKSVMVMTVYAPDCKKEFDGHERFKKKKAPVSYETDVELGPKNSISPATSMWSRDYYVQTRTTTRSLVKCTNLHAGKDDVTTKADSRRCCVAEL